MTSVDLPSLEEVDRRLSELDVEVKYLKGLKKLIGKTDHLRQRLDGNARTPAKSDQADSD